MMLNTWCILVAIIHWVMRGQSTTKRTITIGRTWYTLLTRPVLSVGNRQPASHRQFPTQATLTTRRYVVENRNRSRNLLSVILWVHWNQSKRNNRNIGLTVWMKFFAKSNQYEWKEFCWAMLDTESCQYSRKWNLQQTRVLMKACKTKARVWKSNLYCTGRNHAANRTKFYEWNATSMYRW